VPYLGHHKLGAVRQSHIQAMVKHLADEKGLAPGSVRNIYDVTAALFAAAVEDRAIPVSPCRKIRLPRGTNDEVDVPTVEQVEKVRAALDERWRPLVTILAGSGLRVGELLGLTPADVSTVFRTIRVERQRLQSGVISELPKTKKSRRTVPVGDVTVAALRGQIEQSMPDALFTDELGEPLTYGRWKVLLRDASSVAGVDLTSHSLRHFAASALISGGASVKQVQMFLGHSSATITLRTYAHLFPGDEDRTRDVLDAALSPLADSVRTEAASDG
jgi:integrase